MGRRAPTIVLYQQALSCTRIGIFLVQDNASVLLLKLELRLSLTISCTRIEIFLVQDLMRSWTNICATPQRPDSYRIFQRAQKLSQHIDLKLGGRNTVNVANLIVVPMPSHQSRP
jgi:hypothetical protein